MFGRALNTPLSHATEGIHFLLILYWFDWKTLPVCKGCCFQLFRKDTISDSFEAFSGINAENSLSLVKLEVEGLEISK